MTTSTKTCGTGADDSSVGATAWTNPEYITGDDTNYAVADMPDYSNSDICDHTIKIVKGGTVQGNNLWRGTGSYYWWFSNTTSPTQFDIGGSTELWGVSWSASDINASNFGVVLSVQTPRLPSVSHYLKATNFGFTIPTGATIDGIMASFFAYRSGSGRYAYVDYVQITTYYTVSVGPVNLKTYNTNVAANIKTINTNAIANVKTLDTNA